MPTAADLVDDLVHAGEELGERADGPLLQSLGQDGVVGVAHNLRHDVPGVIPLELLLVDEDAHELGDADHRVGVVELEDDLVRESRQIRLVLARVEDADGVVDGGGHEEGYGGCGLRHSEGGAA